MKTSEKTSVPTSTDEILLDCIFRGSKTTQSGNQIAIVQLPDNTVVKAWLDDTNSTLKRGDVVDVEIYDNAESKIKHRLYSY